MINILGEYSMAILAIAALVGGVWKLIVTPLRRRSRVAFVDLIVHASSASVDVQIADQLRPIELKSDGYHIMNSARMDKMDQSLIGIRDEQKTLFQLLVEHMEAEDTRLAEELKPKKAPND